MGVAIVVFGGLLGFIGGLAGWLFAGLPLVAALLVWALSGPVTALVLIALVLPPKAPGLEPVRAQAA